MSGYRTLLRMQIRHRLSGLTPKNLKAELQNKRFQTISIIAAYGILVVSLVSTVVLMESQLLGAMIAMGTPELLLALAVLSGMLMTVMFGFFYIITSLYMGKDAAFLASLPIPSRTIFAAKLTEIWMGETCVMALIFVPACVIYGIRLHPDALFYIRALLVLALSPVIPMAIVTVLSTLLVRLSSLVKKRDTLIMVGSIALIALMVYLQMSMTRLIPEDASEDFIVKLLENNRALITAVTGAFPPAQFASRGLLGEYDMLLLFLAIVCATAALLIWLLGGSFQKLSLAQGESYAGNKKVRRTEKTFRAHSPFAAMHIREWREILRSPSYAINSLACIAMPVILAIVFGANLSGSNVSLANLEDIVTMLRSEVSGVILAGCMAGVFCMCAGINPAVATAVSREGAQHMLTKLLPVSPREILLSKLAQGVELAAASCCLCCALICALLPSLWVEALAGLLIALMLSYCTCALSLFTDVLKPRFQWNTETEAIKQNTNVLFSMLISFAALVLMALVTYLCYTLALPDAVLVACYVVLPVLMCVICHRLLSGKMSTLYAAIDG